MLLRTLLPAVLLAAVLLDFTPPAVACPACGPPSGQTLTSDSSALAVLREAVRRSDFHRKRAEYKGTNRGIGLALFFHGAGFTGSGELRLASKARLELTATGVRILVSSTEIGQGTRTMHAQIVADAMEMSYDDVRSEEHTSELQSPC